MAGCWIDILLYVAIGIAVLAFAAIFLIQGKKLREIENGK